MEDEIQRAAQDTPSFAVPVDFACGDFGFSVIAADFNGDSRIDLAVANVNNSVSILLNTTPSYASAPSFAAGVTFATGTYSGDTRVFVTAADFNGDGRMDLAATNILSDTVGVLLNTTPAGASTPIFATRMEFGTGRLPVSVAAADVNRDGRIDLAVVNLRSSTVTVLLNVTASGGSTPSFAARRDFDTGRVSETVTAVDVNADGRPDLAVTNANVEFGSPGSSDTVSVLLNNTATNASSPDFAERVAFGTGLSPSSVTGVNLNDDRRIDLAAANFDGGSVSVLILPFLPAEVGNSTGVGTILPDTDTTPNPFAFVDVSDVARNTLQTSNTVVVTGLDEPAPISVTDGQYSIGCVSAGFTDAPGSISNGQTVCVRHSSSTEFNTSVNTALTVGGVFDNYTSTTMEEDLTPEPFAFVDVDAPRSTLQASNTITVIGINSTAPITVLGGEYSINGLPFMTTQGIVQVGDTVRVRHTSSADFETATDTTLTIGASGVLLGVSDTFTSSTLASDPEPTATVPDNRDEEVSFSASKGQIADLDHMETTPPAAAEMSGLSFPNGFFSYRIIGLSTDAPETVMVTVTLPEGSAPDSVVKCSGDGMACSPFAGASIAGDVVTLTLTDNGAGDNDTVLGQITDPFGPAKVTDTTPNAFTFMDQTNVPRNSVRTSGAVTITGIDAPTPISIVGGVYSIGCNGSFTATAGTISSGQKVCVRHKSSANYNAGVNTVLTVGGVSNIFTSVTAPNAVVGLLGVVFQVLTGAVGSVLGIISGLVTP